MGNCAAAMEPAKELEQSLHSAMEEQLSLAAHWARIQDRQVLELTQHLLEEEERWASLFPRRALARYEETSRQHWQRLLRQTWLEGLRGSLGLAPSPRPEPEELPAMEDFFTNLSAGQTQALLCRRQMDRQLFQAQAPYFRQAGWQLGQLIAALA